MPPPTEWQVFSKSGHRQFLENRKSGLERFLQQVMRHEEVWTQGNNILQKFLDDSENLQHFASIYDAVSSDYSFESKSSQDKKTSVVLSSTVAREHNTSDNWNTSKLTMRQMLREAGTRRRSRLLYILFII